MSSEESISSDETVDVSLDDEDHLLLKPLIAIRESVVAFIVALGILMVVLGWVIDLVYTGPSPDAGTGLAISGIFGVLGVSITLFGAIIYVSFKAVGYN